jgi:malonate-semialdehyde dehydrogenase (acetylating)/methylmalonate-semialdehyde dehydrogenase
MSIMELWAEAEILLTHPDVKGVSFVGSTTVGRHIYATAAALERTARGIVNSACGCAGERCMALPVVAVEEQIADTLVALLAKMMSELKIGPAYDKRSQLGPVVNADHRKFVSDWIQKGIEEGLALMNAREFAMRTHSGMVGINVGIPVPLGIFGFTGRKNSFCCGLHAMGEDGVRFFTELKSMTAHWFSEEEAREAKVLNSWDGMISFPDKKLANEHPEGFVSAQPSFSRVLDESPRAL